MSDRTAERTEFLLDTLTTAAEAGYEWFLWDNIVRDEDYNIVSATVRVLKDDESGYSNEEHVVNADTIARGIGIIRRSKVDYDARFNENTLHTSEGKRLYLSESARKTILDASEANDAGDLDADLADSILQVGVLGTVVFG